MYWKKGIQNECGLEWDLTLINIQSLKYSII